MSLSGVSAGRNLPQDKVLEPGKFSRAGGFEDISAAEEEIMRSEAAYRSAAGAKGE